MKASLYRIRAIAWAEIRFGLRRGLPVLGMGIVWLLFSGLTLWISLTSGSDPSSFSPEVRSSSLVRSWLLFILLAPLILPLTTIQAIPSDRQCRAYAWLHSLPLSGGEYLAGKLLGTLAVVLGTWVLGLVVHLAGFRILTGELNLAIDLDLALTSGLPLVVWNCALSVLAGVWLASRRPAILAGALLGFASLAVWVYLFLASHSLLSGTIAPATGQEALQSAALAVLILVLLAAAARAWLYWKDNF